jgi:hypothetical protein
MPLVDVLMPYSVCVSSLEHDVRHIQPPAAVVARTTVRTPESSSRAPQLALEPNLVPIHARKLEFEPKLGVPLLLSADARRPSRPRCPWPFI